MPDYAALTEDMPPLAYLDGVSLGPQSALVIAAMWGLEDEPERPTRLLHIDGDSLRYVDCPANITSLAVTGGAAEPVVHALTKLNGVVQVYPAVGAIETANAGRPRGGQLLRLHADGDRLFAFGMNGQVVRILPGAGAVPFDDGLYEAQRSVYSLQLRDMAGTEAGGYLVVDAMGRMFERSGQVWEPLDMAGNTALEQVVAADRPGHFWVCGDRGLLFDYGADEVIRVETGVSDGFWGLAVFDGHVYVAGLDDLFRLDPATGDFAPVDFGIGHAPSLYRLDASAGGLLSVGPNDICLHDGIAWRRVRVPSNDR